MEGESSALFGICELGGRHGRWGDGVGAEVYCAGHGVADTLYGRCQCYGECVGYVEVSSDTVESVREMWACLLTRLQLGGTLDQPEYGG